VLALQTLARWLPSGLRPRPLQRLLGPGGGAWTSPLIRLPARAKRPWRGVSALATTLTLSLTSACAPH